MRENGKMQSGGCKLAAIDMDGTLLMSDKRVHPDTVRDLAEAAERGIELVYCSGRAIPEDTSHDPVCSLHERSGGL